VQLTKEADRILLQSPSEVYLVLVLTSDSFFREMIVFQGEV